MKITDTDVDRVAAALGGAPTAAYTTPVVYPWAVQNFEPRPCAERPPPASGSRLYIHIPFCLYHCTFCFYAVRCGSERPEMERYISALCREMDLFESGRSLSRLTVGGGTPTALPPDLLDAVFHQIASRMELPVEPKRKIEASPDSISEAHVEVLKKRRIGWVSLGVESLEDPILGTVTRRHTSRNALEACRLITDSGLRLNVDLIYGLPGQTEESFRRDLEVVAETGARTVCLYALRLNEKTPVAAQLSAEERLDLARLMRWRAFVKRAADELGFEQTRCYTFTRRGSGDTAPTAVVTRRRPGASLEELAIGMSGRSQIDNVVYRNHSRFNTYMQRAEQGLSPVETVFEMDSLDRKTQFLAGTLGASRVLERSEYEDVFGVPIDADFEEVLERLRNAELLEDDGRRLALSETGMLVYDRILLCFYSDRAKAWLGGMAPPRTGSRS